MTDIINPFNQVKKTNWAKKAEERLVNTESKKVNLNKTDINKKQIKRIAKSFKIYPGKISRDFDKRVNKLQVQFDELDYEKDYVDSGKYIMFLMSFAERYSLYDLYQKTDEEGNFEIDKEKLKEFAKKLN
jgi:hypothetical protein